ncbi:beta-glucuronidase, partial [Salmonella enterica]|nr:beta-glucuronidase [Salmonella enterica]
MLRPVETQSREIKKLDGLWSFCTDADDCGIAQQWWRQPLPQSRAIAVPGSY